MNPETHQFEPITEANEKQTRDWTKFQEGEIVLLKGISFYIHEIGETRLVLKPKK